MIVTKKIDEGLLIHNEILITIVDIVNNSVAFSISHDEGKEIYCKEHKANPHISIISDSERVTNIQSNNCEDRRNLLSKNEIEKIIADNIGFSVDNKLLKQAKNSLDSLVELGLKALDAQQYDFAEEIFLLAKEKGYRFTNRYLAVIEKNRGNTFC